MGFFKSVERRAATPQTATHMTFRLGGQLYGIPLELVSEVIPLTAPAPLHSGDEAVVGEIELRGSALVVVDMGLRLRGTPVPPSSKNCILIVRRAGARSGCLFEAAEGMVRIPAEEIELSGCLVEAADGVIAIAETATASPENASLSGEDHGFPLYKTAEDTILLPARTLFFPQ